MKRLLALLIGSCLITNTEASVIISSIGETYSEDFNSLGNESISNPFTFVDNSTILGWTVNSKEMDENSDQYQAGDGSSSTGEVYSFGSDTDIDRAIGYVGSVGNDFFNVALTLENATGGLIDTVNISFTGEQWRSGGDTADNQNLLTFSYRIFDSGLGSLPTSTDQSGWTEVPTLAFAAPQQSAPAGALDGNSPANQTSFNDVPISNLPWDDGQELWIRFSGGDGSGSDAGLAIDDFSAQVIPEPTTTALLALGALFLGFRRRRS